MDEIQDACEVWAAGRRARGAMVPSFEVYRRRVTRHAAQTERDLRGSRVKEAVAQGVIEAFTQLGEPDAPQFDALESTVSAADMARQYPGVDPHIWRDRQAVP